MNSNNIQIRTEIRIYLISVIDLSTHPENTTTLSDVEKVRLVWETYQKNRNSTLFNEEKIILWLCGLPDYITIELDHQKIIQIMEQRWDMLMPEGKTTLDSVNLYLHLIAREFGYFIRQGNP